MNRASFLIAALLIPAGVLHGDVVHRRGAEPPLEGRIVTIDDNGIALRSGLGGNYVIPWDRVRAVDTDRPDPRLEDRLAIATDLWRARSRVQRFDTVLAEPLLERLWPQFVGQTNETTLIIAEGLLRCRLARSAHDAAIVPALEVARLRRAGVTTDRYGMLPAVLDDKLLLCPSLAPTWRPSRALAKLPADLERYDARGDEIVTALARLYRSAALRQLGLDPGPWPTDLPEHSGVALLDSSLRCVYADRRDGEERQRTREQVIRSLTVMPPWADAWAHYFVGLSFLREEGVATTQEGLWHLAHLPASFGASQGLLTDLALRRMADSLRATGEGDAAAALEAERQRLLAR